MPKRSITARIIAKIVQCVLLLQVTRKLRSDDRAFLRKLGKKIEKIILEEKGYSSLDAFALEYYDLIATPTLYQICAGKRDMKISTLLGLSEALDVNLTDMLKIGS